MSKNEVIDIAKTYILLLKSEGIVVEKAYLYGSYLKNTASDDSDIDLLIVTENGDDDYLVGKIWSLTSKVNSKIEPYLVDKKRFYSNEDSPLIDLVRRTGLEIS